MPRGWEGNRRSGVALVMRHELGGLSTCGLNDHRKGDEHPSCASVGYGTLYLHLLIIVCRFQGNVSREERLSCRIVCLR